MIRMPKEQVAARLKLAGILLILLLTPFLGLACGALVDEIIGGLLIGIAVGFGATLWLTRKLPKDGRQTILWTAAGSGLAYFCSTQIVGGKAELSVVLLGAAMGAGASLVLPALQALDEKRKRQQ